MAARSTSLAGALAGEQRLRRSRAAAQLLHRPGKAGPGAIVARLLGIQAQNLRAARLAIRARSSIATAADVDSALANRELIVVWLMRETLHLVGPDDYPWLLALTAPQGEATGQRRLPQEGVGPDDAERGVAAIERALEGGPLTRAELAERVAAARVATEGQAMPHLLALAARRGLIVRGPICGADQALVLTRDWLGIDPPATLAGDARDAALAELARRYLRGHGPASAADIAAWSGLGLRDARSGLAAIGGRLVELDGDLVDLADREPAPESIPPRLLGSFDPYLLGWKDRGFAVLAEHAKRVHPGGGMLRPVVTVDGLVVGVWRRTRGAISVEPFGEIEADLEAETAEIARFEALSAPARAGPARQARRRS